MVCLIRSLALVVFITTCFCIVEKVRYMSLERAVIDYTNTEYLRNLTVVARRRGRADPMYYVNINFTVLVWVDNNVVFHCYFYEFLSNRYKRGFVELHIKAKDMYNPNSFFGDTVKQALGNLTYPFPPGDYVLWNLTVPLHSIPRNFPFTKGRLYLNVTYKKDRMGEGHADMEIKEMKRTL